MKSFLVTVTTLALILPELLVGNWGLTLGLPLFGAIYFAAAYRRRYGIVSAAAAGLILDAVYCRSVMLLVLLLPGIVALVMPLIRRTRRQLPASALLAGAAAGGLLCCAEAAVVSVCGGRIPGPDLASLLIFHATFGALFLLGFSLFADLIAVKCNLPKFRQTAGSRPRREEYE